MKGKILFATGLAVGYVLGTKAGRERYQQIKAAANDFWNSPRVHERVVQVEDMVKDKAPDVVGLVAERAKKVASQVQARRSGKAPTGSATPMGGTASTSPSTSGTPDAGPSATSPLPN